ncbi:MAG: hypothetical protein MUF15_17805, partial [Acidobacteria bacterium]|nr:hypothetical protein [Acidobacteriota bacterium]
MAKKPGFVQLLTLQLLLLPIILLSISTVLFCFNLPISAAHFLVSLAAAVAISFMLARKHSYFKAPGYFKNHNFLKVTALFIILIF